MLYGVGEMCEWGLDGRESKSLEGLEMVGGLAPLCCRLSQRIVSGRPWGVRISSARANEDRRLERILSRGEGVEFGLRGKEGGTGHRAREGNNKALFSPINEAF